MRRLNSSDRWTGMNRATKLSLLALLFAVSSRAQTSPGLAEANLLPDHIQPARNVFAQPFLDTRDAFLFKDKAESILAVAQGLFLVSDGIVTRTSVRNQQRRRNQPGNQSSYRTLSDLESHGTAGSGSRDCWNMVGNRDEAKPTPFFPQSLVDSASRRNRRKSIWNGVRDTKEVSS